MKYIKYLIIILLLFNFSNSGAKENDLHNKITKNLRCLICQGQSVGDSNSEFAQTIKLVVRDQLKNGKSENTFQLFRKYTKINVFTFFVDTKWMFNMFVNSLISFFVFLCSLC